MLIAQAVEKAAKGWPEAFAEVGVAFVIMVGFVLFFWAINKD